MTKVEAPTLEEAYELAATQLSCSVTELQYEVIQYPSKGILGLFKKKAIIVATTKNIPVSSAVPSEDPSLNEATLEEEVASEILSTLKEETPQEEDTERKERAEEKVKVAHDAIVESFFEADTHTEDEVPFVDQALALSIEESLKALFDVSCFDIDVVEVDVVENTALIFIDGEDAALLIGKEGYRYNALSYMIFNWLHTKYQLYIKLEIAEFLTSQQEMIRNYIQPVIENVERYGKGKTRFLDGILVQIALEQLREAFPDKYVAVKTGKSGKKFVVINEFHTKAP
ncbi:Jag N-terminal domain-containing protein [Sulfurovum sp. ST-21]|uniref:Jag N-terminal domain-containing protein n=1 Tax=Sulfurovum indicum TaxID=2779528 RepID=A0A7M1S7H2_9BACT|nr:Jag N-terminal domain-containing protein [Sulfurovum indicum]QOR62669.1 Jag N-terminal domain-containing protein [Sulfurovum indicum]